MSSVPISSMVLVVLMILSVTFAVLIATSLHNPATPDCVRMCQSVSVSANTEFLNRKRYCKWRGPCVWCSVHEDRLFFFFLQFSPLCLRVALDCDTHHRAEMRKSCTTPELEAQQDALFTCQLVSAHTAQDFHKQFAEDLEYKWNIIAHCRRARCLCVSV